jgi:hypothetical protein
MTVSTVASGLLGSPGTQRRLITTVFLAMFVVAFASFLAVYSRFPALQDTDSYYHLALAREIAERGVPARLPWARFTPLAERFGDPVILFHLALAPFAAMENAELGAVVFLAVCDATIFALLAALGAAAIGRWGALLPVVIFLGSTEALFRLVRLRPELAALVLLLGAAWLLGRGKYRWLGVLALLFALSYSAVHAFAGLALASFLVIGWRTRRWPLALLVYCFAGLGLGLVVHPQFPANLESLIAAFRVGITGGAAVGSGQELVPHSTLVAVYTQLGCWIAAAVVWLARCPAAPPGDRDEQARDVFVVFALGFLALYSLSARFVVLALPFAGLALLWSLRAGGHRVGATFAVGGRRLPTALGFGVAALCAAVPLAAQVPRFLARATSGPAGVRIEDRRAVAAKLPAGARVAATWGTADLFAFYAPKARYLEVLDPLPMALHFPAASAAKLRVFGGAEPDPPFAIATALDSEYVLTSRFSTNPGVGNLLLQLRADPRVEVLHDGISFLARILPERNRGFILDWQVAPEEADAWESGLAPTLPKEGGVPYPRPVDARARAVEGYVDLRRLPGAAPCSALVTQVTMTEGASRMRWKFTPSGRAELWWDETILLRWTGTELARLDQAAQGEVSVAAGTHRLAVRLCGPPGERQGDPATRPLGFYLQVAATSF